MRRRYLKFNGKKFKFQSDLGLSENFFDFILNYGDEALEALSQLERDPDQSEMLQELLDQGILEKLKGRWRLTPRAVTAMQRKALMEIFAHLRAGRREGQQKPDSCHAAERI